VVLSPTLPALTTFTTTKSTPLAASVAVSNDAAIEEQMQVGPVVREHGKIVWLYAATVVILHLLAALAVLPWLFSWTGVIVAVVGIYIYGGLGINLCYHRLLSHRSFQCPMWVERVLVYIALCCMQDAPGRWVAAHRIHHKFADDEPDPHSPLVNFLWSHVGWLMVDKHGLHKLSNYERYVRDLLRQPFYLNLERRMVPMWVYLIHALAYFVIGLSIGWVMWGLPAGLQFGLSILVWGVFVRTVAVWHITWSVNSLTHMFGYRNYETDEESRNNWFVAIITSGEGWHNNHHEDPASANNQRRWWEIDLVYGVIWLMERTGLAWNVVRPKHQRRAERAD